jgi:hypothetical protein
METLLWCSIGLNIFLFLLLIACALRKPSNIQQLGLQSPERKQKLWDDKVWGNLLYKQKQ